MNSRNIGSWFEERSKIQWTNHSGKHRKKHRNSRFRHHEQKLLFYKRAIKFSSTFEQRRRIGRSSTYFQTSQTSNLYARFTYLQMNGNCRGEDTSDIQINFENVYSLLRLYFLHFIFIFLYFIY